MTPPISQSLISERLRVLRECKGNQTEAARKLNLSRSALQNTIRLAEQTPKRAAFMAPELPPEDESPEVTVERMRTEFRRRLEYKNAADWMPFKVAGKEPFALAFVGDPHLDECDIDLFLAHMAIIQTTPRMWAIGMGDWINGWVGKLRAQYAHSTVTERQAYALAHEVLNLEDVWWLLIWGNHDGQRWHGEGSPLKWMCNAAAVAGQEWQAKFSIVCNNNTWKIHAAHNFPGRSQYDKGFSVNKRALFTGAEADIYAGGDGHTFSLRQDQHEHTGRRYWAVRARGYKFLDHYALEKGYGPQGGENGIGHSIAAVFDPSDGSVECFSRLDRAASYLRWLQARGTP